MPASSACSGQAQPMYSIEQIELIRRLRNSGLTKEQVVQAFESFERVETELGNLYTVPISLSQQKAAAAAGSQVGNSNSTRKLYYELLHVYAPSHALRSSSDTHMLKIQQYKCKTHGFHTFSCFGPHIWNSFPQDHRHYSTLSSFKAKPKTILFSQYFRPSSDQPDLLPQ